LFGKAEFWDNKYQSVGNPGWDVGYPVPALTSYFDQLENKNLRILIPGGGFGYETWYLFEHGFRNAFYLDFSMNAVSAFKEKFPEFPVENIILDDFFNFSGQFDLIIEHTFFCSLPKHKRFEYTKKMYQLLKPDGKLVGLLFNHDFGTDFPPFGGSVDEYASLFKNCFNFLYFEPCYNSVKPRYGRELFILFVKKTCFNANK